jgi:serine/threonine-protein kinase
MVAVRSPIRVVGRYAIYNEIAAGGMAAIHLGRLLGPVGFARTVAVKRLHPQYAKDPEFVSMFLDEARLAARVQHPNVVATIDVVATEGELFLIMDYVRGESLSKILRNLRREGKRVPARIAAAIMVGFLHGLHAAHEAKNERGEALGLVHRDVSPQNVLVGADGIARVLDFGIAKAAGRIQVTRDGQIKGKLAYMPPEQLTGKEISRAVDIYASAVVMWETVTGERLFKGETDGATLAKILRDKVAAPSSLFADLVPFDQALMRSLDRDCTKRHATARELAIDLERCVGIASPSEVGEWVEGIVGPILSAREDQIAEIESSSASLRLPARPGSPETFDSDDRMALPSTRAILAAIADGNADARTNEPTGTAPMPAQEVDLGGATTVTAAHTPDDATESSRSRAGWHTSSRLAVPIDRKIHVVIGAAAGGVVLLLLLILLGTRGGESGAASASPTPHASVVERATAASVVTPDDSAAPSASAEPPRAEAEAASATAAPSAEPPKPSEHAVWRPAPALRPSTPTAAPTPTAAAAKRNCDPPYVIDAQGRHKYKRECM